MSMSQRFALLLLLLPSTLIAETVPVTFYAMGDVPYAPEEYQRLTDQLTQIPKDAPFVIHLGDIKRGAVPCEPMVYQNVAKVLKTSSTPIFIIPGDNEWNDCLNPDQAWPLWEQNFLKFDENWKHKFSVNRQAIRKENFAFVHQGVLFIGINLVGGKVHDADEWKLRHQQDLAWVTQQIKDHADNSQSIVLFGHAAPKFDHSDFFLPLVKDVGENGKPFLYMHGDGHTWVYDQPFAANNIFRVQVDQGGKAPPVKVTVTGNPKEPFVFDRRK